MYVWVDALTNYITGVGFPDDAGDVRPLLAGRPARHRQGHRPLPRGLLAGLPDVGRPARCRSASSPTASCSTAGRRCRSRSATSSTRSRLIDAYGVDPVRYFFLREVPFGQDGNYSHEAIVQRINADLANDLGNLAQRSLSMIAQELRRHAAGAGRADAPRTATCSPRPTALLDQCRAAMDDAADPSGAERDLGRGRRCQPLFRRPRRRGRSRKTDPARMGTVLYVTAEVVRQVAILVQPVMPASAAKLLDLLGRAGGRRGASRASVRPDGSTAGTTLPAPEAVFPRYVEDAETRPRGGWLSRDRMLVDSHCHLDFPDFDEDRDAVLDRARARPGSSTIVTISTRVAPLPAAPAIWSSAIRRVYCSIGTHPHNAAEEPDVTTDDLVRLAARSEGRGDRRGRARLPLRQLAARGAARPASSATSPRRARPQLPLVIHARDADARHRRHPRSEEAGRGPSPPSSTASRPAASSPGAASSSASTSPSPAS